MASAELARTTDGASVTFIVIIETIETLVLSTGSLNVVSSGADRVALRDLIELAACNGLLASADGAPPRCEARLVSTAASEIGVGRRELSASSDGSATVQLSQSYDYTANAGAPPPPAALIDAAMSATIGGSVSDSNTESLSAITTFKSMGAPPAGSADFAIFAAGGKALLESALNAALPSAGISLQQPTMATPPVQPSLPPPPPQPIGVIAGTEGRSSMIMMLMLGVATGVGVVLLLLLIILIGRRRRAALTKARVEPMPMSPSTVSAMPERDIIEPPKDDNTADAPATATMPPLPTAPAAAKPYARITPTSPASRAVPPHTMVRVLSSGGFQMHEDASERFESPEVAPLPQARIAVRPATRLEGQAHISNSLAKWRRRASLQAPTRPAPALPSLPSTTQMGQ